MPPETARQDLHIRKLREEEVGQLGELYVESVRGFGSHSYSEDAVNAWASFAEKEEEFRRFVSEPHTLVAENKSGVVGFAGMHLSGHIASVYVRPGNGRRGVGSALISSLLDWGKERDITRFWTEASRGSRPLFEKFGFSVTEDEIVERSGVMIQRFKMERDDRV